MTNESKIILGSTIGTILATGLGLAVLTTTLFLSLGNRIDTLDRDLGGRIENLGGRIDSLRQDMREDYQRLDERMRTIEQGFSKIETRLATLERAVIPAAEPRS